MIRIVWIAILAGCGCMIHAATPGSAGVGGAGSLWVVLAGLLLASGLVSASETALFSLDKLDVSQLRGSRSLAARLTMRLLDRPNDTLVSILILNNFVNIAVTLTVAALADGLLAGAPAEAFTLAAAASTGCILLFGEILPKMLAHSHPRAGARLLAPPLSVVSYVLTPVRMTLHLTLRGLYGLFRIPESAPMEEVSEEELKVMINSGEVSSVLEADELEMIDGVFDLRHTTIEEIMTPRTSIVAIPDDLDQAEVVRRLRETTNNRVLIHHDTLDDLVGFVLVKEVLLEPETPWHKHLREPLCVPEQMRLLDLLKLFRRQRMKMAVAVDEYGGVSGIVSHQDLLEEIVGDIYEKHEQRQLWIEPSGEGRWLLNGSLDLDEAAEQLMVEFPTRRGRTVGGFVMNTLGRIPRVGDSVEHAGLQFRVTEMSARRVHRLEVRRLDHSASAAISPPGEAGR